MFSHHFEIDRSGRSQPMEGLRGAAVSLVFLQHYSMQFLVHGDVSGVTEGFAKPFGHLAITELSCSLY